MPAPDRIKKLVDGFENYTATCFPPDFDEASLRMSFIDPFWEELGWNVRDPREVVVEKRVAMRATTKFADYCLLVADKPKLIIESKDPRRKVDDPDSIFQVKRYGYNLPVDFAVLTNFGEFRLYDTGLEPIYENSARGLIPQFSLSFHDYIEQWEKLYGAFSHQAVVEGKLAELLPRERRARNKETLDRKFFEHLSEWRTELAGNIALRNKDLKVHEINEAVQRILDRIIFIRVIEDRGIEPTELLQNALDKWKREKEKPLYRYFADIFRKLKPQYNGQLFNPHFSEDLFIDDVLLKHITDQLYYPNCPYQFNVVGVEMLGTIYERFLGSTIRLTPAHRAVVEEKPEVRKAGGVYYTPKYIVDYIVENTVGKLLADCKTPADVAKLNILDPACGSGSFLLGAFQKLIGWHEAYYTAHPEKIHKGMAMECWWDGDLGRYKLTARYKGEILGNNIYGVDIDSQAVEVTIMSLYLKVLEDVEAWGLVKASLLPVMSENIKCGNSLIGEDYWDFVSKKQEGLFRSEEEERRVNTFDWQTAFPQIFAGGGFDAVIGNPPYIQLSMMEYYNESINDYLTEKYSSSMGRQNTFGYFIENSLNSILKDNGIICLIVPNTILTQDYYEDIRNLLMMNKIISLTTFLKGVFDDAVVETVIFAVQKSTSLKNIVNIINYDNNNMSTTNKSIPQDFFINNYRHQFTVNVDNNNLPIKIKIDKNGIKLSELVFINQAIALKYDRKKSLFTEKDSDEFKPVLDGRNINRYQLCWDHIYLKYDINNIHSCKRVDIFESEEKLFFRRVGRSLIATYDDNRFYALNTLVVINKMPEISMSLKYILALFNSKLMSYYYIKFLKSTKSVFSEIQAKQVGNIPIHVPVITVSSEMDKHDRMVEMVTEMLDLHKRLAAAKTDTDKSRLQERIKRLDADIDALVYQLYGLTDEEIKIVENS